MPGAGGYPAGPVNYRHTFHAGNFADCVKHAILVRLLRALRRKEAPFAVLDTHAGRGAYDLSAPEAARTGEWRQGIGRLLDLPGEGPLADYVGIVSALGAPARYPGSPALVRALLRPQDRLVCVERHPEEHAALAEGFRHDRRQVAVHRRDAWEALRALTPPPERRGLVLMDPPFEQEGEFDRLADAIALLRHRFRAGILAAWYPIKHRAPVRAFHAALREGGGRDLIAAELWLREPTDPARLNGCGVLVANAPFRFAEECGAMLMALLAALGTREPGEGWAVTRVVEE